MALVHKIFGPPGSGKTTYLLGVVEKELAAGTAPHQIGYFSFTRKAATEAKERAHLRFPHLNPRTSFPFFRTLHSLSYLCLGARMEDMMQPKDYHDFGAQIGLELSATADDEEGMAHADHPVLNEINLARIRNTDLRAHYNRSKLDIEWHFFEFVERSYRKFKQEMGLMDFTDLLEQLAQAPQRLPTLEVVIVDEAQDLSRLQWTIVEELAKRAKRVYVAGDDDQAVFTWAGADVNSFLSFSGDITVLEQSYRVPQQVFRLANGIVNRIHHRQPKTWHPRPFEGQVQVHQRFDAAPVHEGQWLILAATNYLLNPVCAWLKGLGVFYERNGVPSIPPRTVQAVVDWERLRRGRAISGAAARNVYSLLDSSLVKRGFKDLKSIDPLVEYTSDDLIASWGLLGLPVWFEGMTRIREDRRSYMQAILKRGTRITSVPRVRVSTIHGAKGGEADNVLLLMDLSPKFAKDYFTQADDVHRLFYVGVTRTRQQLHLVLPRNVCEGFPL